MTPSTPPKPHPVFHIVAIFLLAVVAVLSLVGSFHQYSFSRSPFESVLAPVMAISLWGFLIWRLWQRPRNWGLGIGIFLLLMLVGQTWLMALAVRNPNIPKALVGHPALSFVLHELPIAAAAIACLSLRFVSSREYTEGAKRLATDTQ
ncbi:MAG: hypothetical protein ABJF10_08140 [Chthoniobacter sp.]|uniref:hypothetical protein n=1 Tax=Chthoniobacter sp. TaxID=2510640 RepID=UPI0032AAD86C